MKRLTQEEFINRCKSVFGDGYDFKKTKYINDRTKVIITNEHGEDIEIFPSNLKKYKGKKNKYTTETFIRRAKQIYGDKYSYEKVKCSNSHDKVIITCKKHGDFTKSAYTFLQGQECPICGNRYSNEKFIEKAEKIHGGKYDYSKIRYINTSSKVIIICPKHGEFLQSPSEHLRGDGCPRCAQDKNSEINRLNFFEKCRKIYGDKYDYSKTDYKDSNSKISIICPEHGVFWKTAIKHSIGQGCPVCSKIKSDELKKLTTEDFIKMAREKHGDKYNYSEVVYKGWEVKVPIICKKHGIFLQTPHSHIGSNSGCPKCRESHSEKEIERYLNKEKIQFETQKTFEWLKYKKKMHLDFYLPAFNVGIEFQGGQHFIPMKYGARCKKDDEQLLQIVQKRDEEKYNLCEQNNLEILYIIPLKYRERLYGFYHKAKIFNNIQDVLSYINAK